LSLSELFPAKGGESGQPHFVLSALSAKQGLSLQ
jgi:hypothetical protein